MADAPAPSYDQHFDLVVTRAFSDRGEMAVRWILVADIVDVEGNRSQVVATAPEAQVIDTLGLLHFGVEVQREAFREG